MSPRLFLLTLLLAPSAAAQTPGSEPPPVPAFHLTARPLHALPPVEERLLDLIEGVCRAMARQQDARGAIVDPYLGREHQYATPYFAAAVGALLAHGRGADLQAAGIRAMTHATRSFAGGWRTIPDAHGEFFIAPLTHALADYRPHVPPDTLARWRSRMQTPVTRIMRNQTGRLNNWRTYAMKGEWARARAGLVPEEAARAYVEHAWHNQTQRERIAADRWNLYQDWSSDPQSHAVEAVGRGNLTALLADGYDGPSAAEMRRFVRRGSLAALLLQAPDGQTPPNGRTDNHVFNDVLYGLIFAAMAEDARTEGDSLLAGRYRRAAHLSLESIPRWHRPEGPEAGAFSITKNRFDPAERVGYQPASQWGNYNGAVALHLAEWLHAHRSVIAEQAAPTEIGGYAMATDPRFSSFTANAGGMHVFANLRGASVPKYDLSWTPLGVVRFGRAGWDGRLGPGDGEHDRTAGRPRAFSRGSGETADAYRAGSGLTFGPAWPESDADGDTLWVRIADVARHYRATPTVTFVHPLLVRFELTYHYATGRGGPYFRHAFTVTPDGVLTRLASPSDSAFALTIPLLEDDGAPLRTSVAGGIARTAYTADGDEQAFLALDPTAVLESGGPSLRSTYGWLRPVRVRPSTPAPGRTIDVFVYPHSPDDPSAETVRSSFRTTDDGFSSILGRVEGNLYIGRTAAGGVGDRIDLDGDGTDDVTFDTACAFVLQLRDGRVIASETDRAATMRYAGRTWRLTSYDPVSVSPR